MQYPIRQVVLAATTASLYFLAGTFSTPANAHCPHNGNWDHKHCSSDDGGGGSESKPKYDVALIEGEISCTAPIFDPGDLDPPVLATTVDVKGPSVSYSAVYPRHLSDGGPTLITDTGAQLADDIRIVVETNEFDQIVTVQIKGQPEIGKESLAHESEVVPLKQSVVPLIDEPFTVRVDADDIPLWQLSRHTGGKRVQIVGKFCLGVMVYTPQP